jgi:hypothetical protein
VKGPVELMVRPAGKSLAVKVRLLPSESVALMGTLGVLPTALVW